MIPTCPLRTTTTSKQKRVLLQEIRAASYSTVKSQEWGDKSWSEHGEYGILRKGVSLKTSSNLIYIYNPKTGSDTIRYALRGEVERSNKLSKGIILNKTDLQRLQHSSFVFTSVRHPEERITSAYSTMVNRLYQKGWAHNRDVQYNITRCPESSTDISAWEDHFRQMVHEWMTTVDIFGWNHPDLWYDQHLIPQIEYLKGYNISLVCCTNAMERCFSNIGLNQPKIVRNSYEKASFMPVKKFQKFDLLTEESKALVRKLYADDYILFNTFCESNGDMTLDFLYQEQPKMLCH